MRKFIPAIGLAIATASPVFATEVQPNVSTGADLESSNITHDDYYVHNTPEMPASLFVGANLGLANITYDDYYVQQIAPNTFFKMGFDVGIKLGTAEKIYNFGASVFYDKLFSADLNIDPYTAYYYLGITSASVGYSVFGATFDNYIMIATKDTASTFFTLGIGYAKITETITVNVYDFSADEKYDTGAFLLKLGVLYSVNEKIGLTFNTKLFFPSYEYISLGTTYEIGVRYTF